MAAVITSLKLSLESYRDDNIITSLFYSVVREKLFDERLSRLLLTFRAQRGAHRTIKFIARLGKEELILVGKRTRFYLTQFVRRRARKDGEFSNCKHEDRVEW